MKITENLLKNAKQQMKKKQLYIILLNKYTTSVVNYKYDKMK